MSSLYTFARTRLVIFTLFILLFCNLGVNAQWSTTAPTVVCNASGWQRNATIIGDGTGGYIMAWMDHRGSLNDPEFANIYLQRLDANGIPQWNNNGILVCGAAREQDYPLLALCQTSDNQPRVIVVWKDNRDKPSTVSLTKIYAQSLDLNGNIQWQTDGVQVADCNGFTSFVHKIIPSDDGKKLVVAYRRRDSNFNLESLRIQSISIDDGSPLYNSDGVVVTTGFRNGSQVEMSIAEDDNSKVNIVWVDDVFNGTSNDIFAQRFDFATGTLQWGNTKEICRTTKDQQRVQLAGNYIAWEDFRFDTGHPANSEVYAQRIDANGNPLWTVNGINVVNENGTQRYPKICTDTGNNLWVTWADFYINNADTAYLSVQKVLPSGQLPFGLKGIRLNSGATSSAEGMLVSQSDGTVLLFYNAGYLGSRYRVHKLNGNGEKLWGELGQPAGGVAYSSIERVRDIEGIPLPNGEGAVFAVAEYSDIWAMRAKICDTPPVSPGVVTPIKRCTPLIGNSSYNLTLTSAGCATGQTRYYERPDGYNYITATSSNPNETRLFGADTTQYIYAECVIDGCANTTPLSPLAIIIANESVSGSQVPDYPLIFRDPTYEILSKTYITASNKISPVSTVNLEAVKAIELLSGFTANNGAVFKAEVKECVNLN